MKMFPPIMIASHSAGLPRPEASSGAPASRMAEPATASNDRPPMFSCTPGVDGTHKAGLKASRSHSGDRPPRDRLLQSPRFQRLSPIITPMAAPGAAATEAMIDVIVPCSMPLAPGYGS